MTSNRRHPALGDVFELDTPAGLAYFQYTHKNKLLGPLLRILPGTYSTRPDLPELVKAPERFWVFFPLGAAVRRNIVRHVGHEPIPPEARPFPLMRMAGPTTADGTVLSWAIWDGEDIIERVPELNTSQRHLSLAQLWNDTILAERIASGWKPEDKVTRM